MIDIIEAVYNRGKNTYPWFHNKRTDQCTFLQLR